MSRLMTRLVSLLCVASSALAGTGAPTYQLTELAALPDMTSLAPSPPVSIAKAISADGTVAGISNISGGCVEISSLPGPVIIECEPVLGHAVRWDGRALTDLGLLGVPPAPDTYPQGETWAWAINRHHQIVGEASRPELLEGLRGFVHLPSAAHGMAAGLHELPGISTLDAQTRAYDISDTGMIVGHGYAAGFPRAAYWKPVAGQWVATDLGAMGGVSSFAYGVNAHEQITGYVSVGPPISDIFAFLWLPEPAYGLSAGAHYVTQGHPFSFGNDVNDLGQIAGRGTFWQPMLWLPEPAYGLPAGVTIFSAEEMFSPDVLNRHGFLGAARAEFNAINNHGVGVGFIEFEVLIQTPVGPQFGLATRGFVWRDRQFHLVEDLMPSGADWDFVPYAWDVNDAGQIVGQGTTVSGDIKGFILTPMASTPGDLNGDGDVDGVDLATLLAQWGRCTAIPECFADLDGSGAVNGIDLAILLAAWAP